MQNRAVGTTKRSHSELVRYNGKVMDEATHGDTEPKANKRPKVANADKMLHWYNDPSKPTSNFTPDLASSSQNPVVLKLVGTPPNITLPLQFVENVEDQSTLTTVDTSFSSMLDTFLPHSPGIAKIYQKRVTVNPDHYLVSYSWRYNPNFYLSLNALIAFKNEHLRVEDIKLNISGGCCSKESNKIIGIATPCYCDVCAYERETRENAQGGGGDFGAPIPRSPEGGYGRCMIKVTKTLATSVMNYGQQ